MKKELNTSKIFDTVSGEIGKLDADKSLHFVSSYYLCMDSKPFSRDEIDSSICILKSVIDSFRSGLEKEFQDSDKDFRTTDVLFDKILENLQEIYYDYVEAGLTEDKHETDLLANLIGIGTFMINQSMRDLNWKLYDSKIINK